MSETVAISVCIPAYEMGGEGANFLRHSLDILMHQSFQDFEVIVADQSSNREIEVVCDEYPKYVRHVRTSHLEHQASANTNAAVDAARGEIIKILFQDDFLAQTRALSEIIDSFEKPEVNWCLTGSLHTHDTENMFKPFVPRYHDRIQFGKNTISSPSVLAYRRSGAPRFDESLIWLMDVDFYKRCGDLWGPPDIIPEPLAVNRLHKGQVSVSVGRGRVRQELRHIRGKYKDQMSWYDWLHYLGRLRRTWV
ncbi:MAG: glycosyltransferase [Burkholderiales bacterium]|nr:glycosyltransferase [Burkholderiales bacterium]